jgi:hypothetical protein
MSGGGGGKKGGGQPTVPTYNLDAQFVLCHGPIDKITEIRVDEKVAWEGEYISTTPNITIDSPELFGGLTREGGVTGLLACQFGGAGQAASSYLTAALGPIPAFRGVVTAILAQVYVGLNYYLKPWSFLCTRVHTRQNGSTQWNNTKAEVSSISTTSLPGYIVGIEFTGTTATVIMSTQHKLDGGETIVIEGVTGVDASLYNGTFTIETPVLTETRFEYIMVGTPSANAVTTGVIFAHYQNFTISGLINAVHVVRECLTDTTWGYGYAESLIDDVSFTAAALTCYNEGLGFGFLWNSDTGLDDFISMVLDHIQGTLYQNRVDGKFYLTLVRKIADPTGLLALTVNNTAAVDDFARKSIGDLVSTVTVEYINNDKIRNTFKKDIVSMTDIALLQRQGTPVTKKIMYEGVVSLKVAQQLAIRDLRQLSTPLYTCTIKCDRTAENLNKGDAFTLTWPDYVPDTLTMRVLSIDLGSNTKGVISISAVQDVFSAPDIVYTLPPPSGWTPPINPPVAVVYRLLTELPYYLVAIRMGDSYAQGVAVTTTFNAIAGASPTGDSIAAKIYSTTGTSYVPNGSLDFCMTGLSTLSLSKTDTIIHVSFPIDLISLTEGNFIQIDDELIGVVTISDTTLTVIRGVLDTVPAIHSAGARIFGWEDFSNTDGISYVLGETSKVKLLTITPIGTLAIALAPEDTVTLVGRMHRPYPPGNVKIAGDNWKATAVHDNIILTWTSRNRLQQTTGLIDWYTGSITSEASVTYSAELRKASDSTLLDSFTGEVGLTRTMSTTYIGSVY